MDVIIQQRKELEDARKEMDKNLFVIKNFNETSAPFYKEGHVIKKTCKFRLSHSTPDPSL